MVVETGSAGASALLDANCADDHSFDSVYPAAARALSRRFWTPVDVARRAAALFREAGVRRVLDVGAGVGKFAIVAAAAAPEMLFVGIEQRKQLVDIARRVRSRLRISNVRFRVGDVTLARWQSYDAFYFFNPFAENVFAGQDCIDSRVELTESRFIRDVARADHALRAAPNGTVVVTYHGNSGRIPAGYELSRYERAGSDWLQLWVKRRDSDGRLFALEPADCGSGALSPCRGLSGVRGSSCAQDHDGHSLDARGRRR
ncbi:MAG TPA: methyltransferase domain-containing protein [Polyangiaceae bacterium]|nr:methyltransferase domain-containing protein [Polyangiaceae bacterium]